LNLSKIWLNILATVNIIIFFTILILGISDSGFFFVLTSRYNYFLMFFSSLSIYLRRVKIATALQIGGCSIQEFIFFMQMGVGMAFTNTNFWESLANSPFVAREFFSLLGFCVIAIGLLIFEYRKYYTKKHQKIIS